MQPLWRRSRRHGFILYFTFLLGAGIRILRISLTRGKSLDAGIEPGPSARTSTAVRLDQRDQNPVYPGHCDSGVRGPWTAAHSNRTEPPWPQCGGASAYTRGRGLPHTTTTCGVSGVPVPYSHPPEICIIAFWFGEEVVLARFISFNRRSSWWWGYGLLRGRQKSPGERKASSDWK